jgi:ATP-dependent DNA helicase RecG
VKILELISENKEISIPQIAEKIGLTTRAIEKNISILQKQGKLKRIGPAKGGHWEVLR